MPVRVTCALIIDDVGRLFAAQRSTSMRLPLKWELPGGKVEADETDEQCLIREIKEELNVQIEISQRLPENLHSYPTFDILLIPFIVRITFGEIQLKEHVDFKWLDATELMHLDWAEADIPIVERYIISLN